jgi:hypothetical protein
MKAWYTLHTKPHCELQLQRALIARGLTTYLPLLGPDDGASPEPLFPQYLFVYCDMAVPDMAALQWPSGLCEFVRLNGQPAVVPEPVIELIRARLSQARGDPPALPLRADAALTGSVTALSAVFQLMPSPKARAEALADSLPADHGGQVALLAGEPSAGTRPRRCTRGHGRYIHYRDG